MSVSEFEIISRFFNQPSLTSLAGDVPHDITLGIGDDCALLTVPEGKQLAVSMDVLVEGVHFPKGVSPRLIAGRALAVNLSDLAAMGAEPLAFTLGLTCSDADEKWLLEFAEGLSETAQRYKCPLIGGDLTKGPLTLCIQVHGVVDKGKALLRKGAKVGDKVYVSGELGAAGLALEILDQSLCDLGSSHEAELLNAYYAPEPRLRLGKELIGFASAAIDVSDGLVADARHIAKQSGVGIQLNAHSIPLAKAVSALKSADESLQLALSAGDEYELLFTSANEHHDSVMNLAENGGVKITCIGEVVAGEEVNCLDEDGSVITIKNNGYTHF